MLKITFYGGAKTVTGANYLLESENAKILVDCGLFQGPKNCEERNFELFPYNPKTIDAVLITHSHVDHVGRLPKLVKEGFKGKFFSTPPTKDFARCLLADSEGLLVKETEKKGLPPIYETKDLEKTMALWETAKYHEKFAVKDFEIEFYDAGHILGSAFIGISTKEGKKIVFSGDLGNVASPLVKDAERIIKADYVLIESAYGNRLHKDLEKRKDILEDIIEDTIRTGGALMIPAFAMERTQELLYELNELAENGRIPKVPVFVDSPLAVKITEVFKQYSRDPEYIDEETAELARKGDLVFKFSGLKFTQTTEESKAINEVKNPKIIIAGSGMSQGGRILHHERRYLSDPKSAILFIGYQVKGSLGRQILDGAESVKMFGEEIPVKCRVENIGGYSAHADQRKLISWLKPERLKIKKVFVVQGEEEESLILAQKIQDELAVEAAVPDLNESYVL